MQNNPVRGRSRKSSRVENRVMEARQPTGPQECCETAQCGGKHTDFERHEEKYRPAIERSSARVERIVDHRTVPLQKIGESGHRQTTSQHRKPDSGWLHDEVAVQFG